MPDSAIALLETTALGVTGMFVTLVFNAFFSRRISLRYEVRARRSMARQQYNRALYFFFHAVVGLAIVQVGAIVIWAALLRAFGVVDDMLQALLFAGSCYTTVGILSDIATVHWRLLPIFIAVSGIFSFALSTANVVGMAPLYRKAWFSKHARRVRDLLEAEHVDADEVGLTFLVEEERRRGRRG
jgi:hypothetical protein